MHAVAVQVLEDKVPKGGRHGLNEVIAAVGFSGLHDNADAVVGAAAVGGISRAAREVSGGVGIGDGQVAGGLGLDDNVVAGLQFGEGVSTGRVRGDRGADDDAVHRIAIAIRIGVKRDDHARKGGIAIAVAIHVIEHAACDHTGLLFDEVLTAGFVACHHADRTDRIGIAAIDIAQAVEARGLGFHHAVSAWRKIGEFIAAIWKRSGRDRLHARSACVAIDRIATAVHKGERDSGDASVTGVVIVRVRQDGAADDAGLFVNEVHTAGGGASHDLHRTDLIGVTTVAVADVKEARRLGLLHSIGARGHIGEGVAAIGLRGRGDRLHARGVRIAIDWVAAAIDQRERDAGDWIIAIVVIVRVGQDGASDGAGQFFDEVIASIALSSRDRHGNAVVGGAAVRHVIARRGCVAIGDCEVTGRLGLHDHIVSWCQIGEAVSAVGRRRGG